MTDNRAVAILGGGRWARVLAGAAMNVLPANSRLVLCSPSNSSAWEDWQAAQSPELRDRCRIGDLQTDILSDDGITHVMIARRAADHAASATRCLSAGKMVLVEKPFASSLSDAHDLVAHRNANNCVTGLVFRYGESLKQFQMVCEDLGGIDRIEFKWSDPKGESRYGELKGFDSALNVAWDVFPHVWSILARFVNIDGLGCKDAGWQNGGKAIFAELKSGNTNVSVLMERDAVARQRLLHVYGSLGGAVLDFSSEPGTAQLNGVEVDVSQGFESPLARQLRAFFYGALTTVDPLTKLPKSILALALCEEITQRLGQPAP